MTPPPLIDDLIGQRATLARETCEIKGKTYARRRLPYYAVDKWPRRVGHAWLVLTGRAMAFQYAEDRFRINTHGVGVRYD